MKTYLMQGLGFGLAAAAQPGPFQTYLISQALTKGWRRTLPAALAPLISDGPIILLAILILNRFPAGWQNVLSIIGGLFVLYLSWDAYKTWRNFNSNGSQSPKSDRETGSVVKAALMNGLSPGPYLFWGLVTGPILIAGWSEGPVNAVTFLIGFYGAMIFTLAVLIVAFGIARNLGQRINRLLVGVSALALLGFGIHQILRGLG
jgi:threonine/homoserine/homoserine lactone efflux protein